MKIKLKAKCLNSQHYYRPQRSWGKVMFLHVSNSVHGGGLPQCMLGYHPPGTMDPPRSRHPAPGTRHLLWDQAPPGTRHTPGSSACWDIRETSGWYASYWNAFLLLWEFTGRVQPLQHTGRFHNSVY